MSTLHRIRKFASVAVLATGALIASSTQADEGRTHARAIADLGQMTVLAPRDIEIAQLGSLTVTAPRLSDTRVADLGAMTVTARRFAQTRVADLGSITVTAPRSVTVTVAARRSDHTWN